MGDQSQSEIHSELLAFLERHGRSLTEYGSTERGLKQEDTKTFLSLLFANGIPLLGVEIWRDTGGRLSLDGLESWYSSPESLQANHLDALQYLANIKAGPNDVLAIQFG